LPKVVWRPGGPKFSNEKDVLNLLLQEVHKAGGQSAWCRKTGIEPATLSRALHQHTPPAKTIIAALKLRMVYVKEENEAS
jgi:DNA-binding phage protein